MNTDLQKRIEEAAEKYALSLQLPSIERTYYATRDNFKAGAEHGYKVAIALAKEWLKGHIGDFQPEMDDLYLVSDSDEIYYDGDELLTDFETNMNKLWEEKK